MTASYGVIYVITNAVNGKRYVGQTTAQSPLARWKDHLKLARNGTKSALYAAIRKHGSEHFSFEVVCGLQDKLSLDAAEDSWIQSLGTLTPRGYNLRSGGANGKHHSASIAKLKATLALPGVKIEHRARAREIMARPGMKEKQSAAMTAAMARPEVRAKHAAIQADPDFQVRHSEGIKAALARPEIKAKQIAGLIGALKRPEVQANIRAGLKIANDRPEVKERRSAVFRGRRWIHNDKQTRRIKKGDPLPPGWSYGRAPVSEAIKVSLARPEIRRKKSVATKGRRWIHDGHQRRRLKCGEMLPEGWAYGVI